MTETRRAYPKAQFRPGTVPGLADRADLNDLALSQRAAEDLGDYYYLLGRSFPALSEGEWLLLMDVLNDTILDRNSVPYLWAEITDAYDADPSLSDKWGVAVPGLIDKLRRLSLVELLAVADAVRRFWRIAPGLDSHEALVKIGAIER